MNQIAESQKMDVNKLLKVIEGHIKLEQQCSDESKTKRDRLYYFGQVQGLKTIKWVIENKLDELL